MTSEESLFYKELIDKCEFNRIQSPQKAQEYLALIGSLLNNKVYIIDPYLNNPDFIKYLILSSSKLKEIYILTDFSKTNGHNYSFIKNIFIEFCSNNNLKCKFFIKTLSDSNLKDFHDRFILADERGWIIGTSFNYLGDKQQSYIIDVDNHSSMKLLSNESKPKYSKLHYLKIHFREIWDSISYVLECEVPNVQF